jgi:hypothetical protein
MKKILIAAVALSALSAPAFAETANVNVTANVGAACTTGIPLNTPLNIGTISSGVGVLNSALVNAIAVALPGPFVCNGMQTSIAASATNLTGSNVPSTGAISAGFTNVVTYTVDLTKPAAGYVQNPFSSTVVVTATSGAAATVRPVGLVNSGLGIDVNGSAAAGILVAGTYTGTMTLVTTPTA